MYVHLNVILIKPTKCRVRSFATGKFTMELRWYGKQEMSRYDIDHHSVSLLRLLLYIGIILDQGKGQGGMKKGQGGLKKGQGRNNAMSNGSEVKQVSQMNTVHCKLVFIFIV